MDVLISVVNFTMGMNNMNGDPLQKPEVPQPVPPVITPPADPTPVVWPLREPEIRPAEEPLTKPPNEPPTIYP